MTKYQDLPLLEESGERHAWDYFGRDDELGTLNRIAAEHVREAAGLVRTGEVISLNLTLDEPGVLADGRGTYEHHVDSARHGRDDHLDNLWLQGSSQWDGFRHVRFRQFGYYGGRQETDLDGSDVLGIDRFAAHGIVGRGVLLDVAGFAAATGLPWKQDERTVISLELLEQTAASQGTVLRLGDILMVRTGWLGWYRALNADDKARVGTAQTMCCPGLAAGRDIAEWLWDHGIAAVGADNAALEALPIQRESGFLHHRILPLFGMPIGELWDLDPLAEHCRADGRFEGFFVSGPLALRRGVGSPANAYVVK